MILIANDGHTFLEHRNCPRGHVPLKMGPKKSAGKFYKIVIKCKMPMKYNVRLAMMNYMVCCLYISIVIRLNCTTTARLHHN